MHKADVLSEECIFTIKHMGHVSQVTRHRVWDSWYPEIFSGGMPISGSDASFFGPCLSKHPNSFVDHEVVYTIGEMCYSSAMTIDTIKK